MEGKLINKTPGPVHLQRCLTGGKGGVADRVIAIQSLENRLKGQQLYPCRIKMSRTMWYLRTKFEVGETYIKLLKWHRLF